MGQNLIFSKEISNNKEESYVEEKCTQNVDDKCITGKKLPKYHSSCHFDEYDVPMSPE